MTILYINTGSAPNQGNGDTLRLAFTKINQNFEFLETFTAGSSDRLINGSHQVILQADGKLTVPGPIYQGTAYDDNEYPNTAFRIDSDTDSYAQFIFQNHNAGTNASTDIVLMNDEGDDFTNIIDLGINSTNYSSPAYNITQPGDGYLFTNGGNLVIGTQTPGKKLVFHAGGTTDNSSGGYLDSYAWNFNRSVHVEVQTPGPLNFTVKNPQYNSASTAVYQAINDGDKYAQFGIQSTHPGANDGNIGPGEVFLHGHDAGNTTHIGNKTNIALYSNENDGYFGTATLFLNKTDFSSTFRGGLLPNEDALQNIGSTATAWKSLYLTDGIYLNGIPFVAGAFPSDVPPPEPHEGYIWYDSASGRLYVYFDSAWVDASPTGGGGGGITTISLSAVAQDIKPATSSTYNIGSSTYTWNNLYVDNVQTPRISSGDYTWNFGTDGGLTLPNYGVIRGLGNTVQIASDAYVQLQYTTTPDNENPNNSDAPTNYVWVDEEGTWIQNDVDQFTSYIWNFNNAGDIILPTDRAIRYPNGDLYGGGGSSSVNILIDGGFPSSVFDETSLIIDGGVV